MPKLRNFLPGFAPASVRDNGTSHETLQVNKTSLPIELLMHIVSYIKDRKDLMSVELTSRIFRSVALPLIYQTIVISENGRQSLDYQRQTLLYRSLQSSPALDTVTTVDLYLAKWKTCSKAMAPTSNSIKRCNCNRLDRLLGEALSCLPNLESLSLKCNLCWSKASDQRHRHLAHLKTTKLRELWLRCRCSEWNHTYELTADILSSPGMSSLISLWLEWSIAGAMTLPVSLYKDLFANPGNLPSISWLYHDGSMLSDMVITERPITRLAYYPIHSEHSLNLQPLLGQCGNNLTHLFIDNVLSWLPAHIKANPGVYTRLRYVGSLRFKEDSTDEIISKMQPFSALPNLQGIVISSSLDVPFRWNEELLNRLRKEVPTIHMVYYHPGAYSSRCVLFELTEHWKMRLVENLGHWEMLNGGLESF